MAQTDSEKFIKKMDTMIDQLDANMADIHKNTYSTTKELDNAANNIVQSIDDELAKFNHLDNDLNQISNVTQIYNRLIQKNGITKGEGKQSIGDSINFFNDSNMFSNVLDSYGENRMIVALDNEYDICCKYMPKLQMALDLKRDNVLSADNFKKEYINAVNKSNHDEEDESIFSNRLQTIIKNYELEELFEDMVDAAYKYGEMFIYNVPYKKAFDELLARKKSTGFRLAETTVLENGIISDSFEEASSFKQKYKAELEKTSLGEQGSGLKIILHKTGIYESVIEEHTRLNNLVKQINESYGSSLYESYITEASETVKKPKEVKFDKTIGDELSFEGLEANDGLIDRTVKHENEKVKTIPGYVIRKLERSNIIPIYIEDICLGYYYLEMNVSLTDEANQVMMNGSMQMQGKSNGREKASGQDKIIQHVAGQLSDHINAHFINTNQDLRKEIYTILKYNDVCNITQQKADLNVSFFPAEDVIHFAFKKDPKTHRGISSIYKGLIPAKLWICITQCNAIGILTRSQDRRVYHVRQQVETNVHKTLINVINQLQKGNFGIRQMESINNVLGIIGRFNDVLIPVGPNGESPINMEIMQGQDIKTNDDFLAQLEENAIGATDVPLELVNAVRGIDYAVHYTMSNSKFLKIIYKDQTVCERVFSKIITRIYNSEFECNDDIEVTLPAPTFLSMTNGANLVENAKAYINAILEVEMAGEEDETRNAVARKLLRHFLPNHLDLDTFDKIKKVTKAEIEAMKLNNNENEE